MKRILLILLVVITTSFFINLQMIPVIIAHRINRFQYHHMLVYYMDCVFYFINIKQDGKPALKQETLTKGITSVNHDHYHGITQADLMITLSCIVYLIQATLPVTQDKLQLQKELQY